MGKLYEDFPVTDTLVFDLPNDGKLLLLFNNTEYQIGDLEEKFSLLLKETTKFPEFKTLVYRLSEEYPQTKTDAVILDLEREYLPYVDQLELSAVIGMDFTGGEFTPVVGGRMMFNFRKFDIGASFTNKFFFLKGSREISKSIAIGLQTLNIDGTEVTQNPTVPICLGWEY